MDFLVSFLNPHDATRVEITVRIGVACFACFCLAIANIPTVVPLSTSYLVGILGACFIVVLPYLLFGIGLVTPLMMTFFIYPWAAATALLAAATVSDGLMVGMYAVSCLFITQLYWGKSVDLTGSMPGFMIALMGMFALGYRPLVQDGLQFSVEDASLRNAPEYMQEAFSAICELEGLTPDCWEDQLPIANEVREITLPESAGILAGQTAYVTATDTSTLSVVVPGGLWIVAGLWKWSGLDNPLAAFRNFMIGVCWFLACWYLGVLLPPIRTLRRTTTRALVPAALTAVSKVVAQTDTVGALNASKDQLTHLLGIITGGKLATVTIFEPRLFTAPTEFIVPQLKALVLAVEQAILASSAAVVWNGETAGGDGNQDDLRDAVSVLSICAKALASNEFAAIENLKQIKDERSHHVVDSLLDASQYVRRRCDKVMDATLTWLDAFNHPDRPSPCSKEGSKNLFKTYSPWPLVMFLPLKRLVETLTHAFHPRTWNLLHFLWAAKLTAGFTGLFCATVYSEAWGDFSIEPNYTSGGVFAGWQLVAFVFVTRPTVEGTVKKGLMRAFGTALGGFVAWLGLIVCSGSWNATGDEVNPYGLIAWLTISTTIAGYFNINPGTAAIKGWSYDHGYAGVYYVEQSTLIALETYRLQGSSNAIAANRIVSNMAGIAAAMVLGCIPPFVKGNDPKHLTDYLTALEDAFAGLLTALLDEEQYSKIDRDDYKEGFLQEALTKHHYAAFLLKDAGRLKCVTLPFFHQDERLVPLMEAMGVTESFLRRLLELAVDILNTEDLRKELAKGMTGHKTLQGILVQHQLAVEGHATKDATDESTGADGQGVPATAPDVEESTLDTLSLFLYLAKHIVKRFQEHETTLSQIRTAT